MFSPPFPSVLKKAMWSMALWGCLGGANAQDAPPLPAAQVAFDQRLEAMLPPLSPAVRYQMTQQGLAEFLTLQEQLLSTGAISENGWVIACDTAQGVVDAWVGRTESLTGVYVGAAWLEQLGVVCRPQQATSWTRTEVDQLARAADRASRALPAAWAKVAPLYRQRSMHRYLSGLNRQGSLELRNRACAQALVADVRGDRLTVPEAWGRLNACPVDPQHPPLSDGSLLERYPDAPLATLVATPFLGISQWASSPMVLAPMLAQPGNYRRLFLDLANTFPVPMVVQDAEAVWLDAFKATPVGPERQAFSTLYTDERTRLLNLALALSNKAPSAEECKQLGVAQRKGLVLLEHPSSWGPFLQNWQAVGVVCPDQALTVEDLPAIQAGWERTWRQVSPVVAQHAARPLPANAAQLWWAQQAQDTPPERRACLQAVITERLEHGYSMSEAWMAARSSCRPAYQTHFASAAEDAPDA